MWLMCITSTMNQLSINLWICEYEKKVFLCFVDLAKVYDLFLRDKLLKCLHEYVIEGSFRDNQISI